MPVDQSRQNGSTSRIDHEVNLYISRWVKIGYATIFDQQSRSIQHRHHQVAGKKFSYISN